MDLATARVIADTWKYEPPYDFYDMTADPEDYEEFVTPELWPAVFLAVRSGDELHGFLTLTESEETGEAESGDALPEIGLGMRPDLTGKGSGEAFVRACLDHLEPQHLTAGAVALSVAVFNIRAIRVYECLGFQAVRTYAQRTNGTEVPFVRMERRS